MKKILFTIAALALLVLPALAQKNYTVTSLGATNAYAAATTTTDNMGNTFVATKWAEIAILCAFQGNDAGTDDITFVFKRSNDGSTWETTPLLTWVVAQNGSTAVCSITNFSLGSPGYIKLFSVQNAAATAGMTNCSVKIAVKPKRQG